MKKILFSLLTVAGVATLAFGATQAFFSDTETSTGNTLVAGKLDLKVDSTAHYAGLLCSEVSAGVYQWVDDPNGAFGPVTRPDLLNLPCDGTWTSTDLDGQQFFNITDIKPGDMGENTLSLTVDDNDSWACVVLDSLQNNDNGLTEPETDVDDTPGVGEGELAENLNFTAWLDQGATAGWQGLNDSGEGDNVWQGNETEPLLFSNVSGPASDVLNGKVYALADSTTGFGPIIGGTTNYLGLQWCAGNMVVDTSTDTITCNGASLGNVIQTDSLIADVSVYIEQHRNNPNFTCSGAGLLDVQEVAPQDN